MTVPTLIATAGSASANSYLSVAEANTIASSMVGTLQWNAATTDDKTRALITATNGLETLSYIGTRADPDQALSWPRSNAACGDKAPTSTEVPRELKLACFDLAEALLGNPTMLRSSVATTGLVPGVANRDLKRLKLDVMELEWRTDISPTSSSAITPLTVLPHLASILGCLTTSTTRSGIGSTKPVVRS